MWEQPAARCPVVPVPQARGLVADAVCVQVALSLLNMQALPAALVTTSSTPRCSPRRGAAATGPRSPVRRELGGQRRPPWPAAILHSAAVAANPRQVPRGSCSRRPVEQTFASLTTDRQTQHDAVADPVRVLPRRRFRQAVGDPEPIAVARGLRPDNRYIHSTAARSQAHHHLSVGGSEREESQSSITNRLTQGADLSQIFNS